MKRNILILMSGLLCNAVFSQTIIDVEAGGGPGGPSPYFAPQFITIQVGDIVRWTNAGGTHNVDGRQSEFPDNPVSFFSGNPGSGWVYEFTFDVPGFYNYECGAFNHATTQFGTITVEDSSVGLEEAEMGELILGPNPVLDVLSIQSEQLIESIVVYGLKGDVVMNQRSDSQSRSLQIDMSALMSGPYVLEVRTASGTSRQMIQKY